MGKLLLLFTAVPFVELYLLVRLSDHIGLWTTVSLVMVTGVLGAALAKSEGLRVTQSWQLALQSGRVPEEGVVSGLLILVGGVLLVTPGVLTDALGLGMLIPWSRRLLSRYLLAWAERSIRRGTIHVSTYGGPEPRSPGLEGSSGLESEEDIIDVPGETVERRVVRGEGVD